MRLYLSCHAVFHRRTSFCYLIHLCYISSVSLYRIKLFYYNQKSAIRHLMSDALTRYICPLSTYNTFIIIHAPAILSTVSCILGYEFLFNVFRSFIHNCCFRAYSSCFHAYLITFLKTDCKNFSSFSILFRLFYNPDFCIL